MRRRTRGSYTLTPTALVILLSLVATDRLWADFTVDPNGFSPPEISYLGKTPFEIRGSGFTQDMQVSLLRQSLFGATLEIAENGTVLRGIIDPILPFPGGTVPAVVTVRDRVTDQRVVLNPAFNFIGPLSVSSVEPDEVAATRPTEVTIHGVGFTPETTFSSWRITPGSAVALENVRFVDARTARATFPAGMATGRHTIIANDKLVTIDVSGEGRGPNVLTILPEIQDVQPRQLIETGGTPVRITGADLVRSYQYRIGGEPLIETEFNADGTEVVGLSPVLVPGLHLADVYNQRLGGSVLFTFEEPIQVLGQPFVTSVTPTTVTALTPMSFGVSGFRENETRIRIGSKELLDTRWILSGRVPTVLGLMPPQDAPGSYDIVIVDSLFGELGVDFSVDYFTTECPEGARAQTISTMFRRGDVDGNGVVEPCDATFLATALETGEELLCPDAADVDDDGAVTIRDASVLLALLLRDPGFGATCAVDATADNLGACRYEACTPIVAESVEPSEVSYLGKTDITIRGSGFSSETSVVVEDMLLTTTVVDSSTIVASIPPLVIGRVPTGEPVDVAIEDPIRGSTVLESALTFLGPLSIASLDPVCGPADGFQLVIHGVGFTSETEVVCLPSGVISCPELSVQPVDVRTLIVGVPSLAARTYSLEVRDSDATGARVIARGSLCVEDDSPPILRGITPNDVPIEGGTEVTVTINGIGPDTKVRIGRHELIDARVDSPRAPRAIIGLAPPGDRPGPALVSVEDPRGDSVFEGEFNYHVADLPLGPQQIETSLAEGSARIRWVNPMPYEQIDVYDEQGGLVATLAGSSTFYEVGTNGSDKLTYTLVGRTSRGESTGRVTATALRRECDRPPPLEAIRQEIEARFQGLEYEDVEFSLYGLHTPADVERCADGEGGGAALITFPPRAGSLEPGRGYIKRPGDEVLFPESSTTTGFTLDQPARKIEIALHGRKIAADFGVELRARLVHVFPDDGFVDEFTFPETVIRSESEWNVMTYFRADSDIGRELEDPDDPGPLPCPSGQECGGLELPAGDYVIEFYVVGGNRNTAYWAISSNPSPEELLIAGTPCPPYPLVRVRDVSDEATLPFVQSVTCTKLNFGICPLADPQRVRLTAEGFWLDSCDRPHDIEPFDTQFEYQWKVYDSAEGTTYDWSHRNWLELCLDCGCYDIEINVRQSGCPVERTYRREIVVRPRNVPCDPSRRFTFFYPQPDPVGTVGIVGLNVPGQTLGLGGYADKRPLDFRVLVSPNCSCPNNQGCAAAKPSDVVFDLGVVDSTGVIRPLGASFLVDDLCDSTQEGPKFLHLALPDLGAVPASSRLDGHDPTNVWIIGRASNQPNSWAKIGGAMRLYNPPPSLAESSWKCNFVEPACYLFETRSSDSNESKFDIGASADLDLELPSVGDGESQDINLAGHPDNNIGGGFASRFSLEAGVWSDEEGVGGTRGQMMGNEISGAPIEAESGGGAGKGGGAGNELPEWEWCNGGNIFNYEFKEDIYKGIIYTGTIWIIPVQVWASIGFGFFFNIDYQLTFKLHPFSILQGYEAECPANSRPAGEFSFADAYLYFLMDAGISIPASIRADILFGVASIGITIEPQANFSFTPWLEAHDLDFSPHMHLGADFKLFVYMQACIFWELLCLTIPEDRVPVIDEPIFSCPNPPFDCVCPSCIEKCGESETRDCAGGGAGDGGGAQVIQLVKVHELVSIPETIHSPDGQTLIDIWMSADEVTEGILNLRQRGAFNRDFQFTLNAPNPYFLDPSGTYVSSNVALVAFTETNGSTIEDVPTLDPNNPAPHIDAANRNAARANIRVHVIGPTTNTIAPFMSSGVVISEDSGDIADWRADGMASMAGSPATGDTWIAWVRYKEDFLADKGMRTIVTTCRSCPPRERFTTEVVRDIQPQIDTTAIYVRQLTYSSANGVAPVGGMAPLEISGAGINIEPELAATPDGAAAVCVWVHDGLHTNLVDDNRGRNLLVSKWRRSNGVWSAPVTVIRDPILDQYPGVLEPRIAMGSDQAGLLEGILAFTAIPEGAEIDDTGMGGLRYLYTVRFHEEAAGNLVFEDPVRIRGRCDEAIYVWDHDVYWEIPELFDPADAIHKHGPDAVVIFNRRGVPGTQHSAGDVMIASLGRGQVDFAPAVCVSDSTRTLTNVVSSITPQGQVHSLFLDQGAGQQAVRFAQGQGAGGGPGGYQTIDARLDPDLAIASCKLSHPFAGPGAFVTATVRVENRGLAGSAMDDQGRSMSGLEISYVDDDGKERLANAASLPVLDPGEDHILEIIVEAPHDPVRLIARITPNPVDLNPSNDEVSCDFGAPCPQNLVCKAIVLPDGGEDDDDEPTLAALLEWKNPVAYEELFVYRDGMLLTTIPGTSERYVDLRVSEGTYRYEVRGAVGVSRSIRPGCEVVIRKTTPEGQFRRGDEGSTVAAPLLHVEYRTTPPNQPPSVNITAPANGSNFYAGQSITFGGSATDPENGNISGNLLWSSSRDGAIGKGGSFAKSNLSVGVHTITATAMDNGGLKATAQITLTVGAVNQPPSVNITAPANGSSFTQGQSITFSGSATDLEDGNVTANLVWTSDKNGAIGNGASFSRNNLSNGAHTITASVMDSGGATGVAQINLLITGVNQSPSVNITAPANGSSFTLGQSITFSGSATDPEDGNVTASLVWTSSLGGQIGIGASFSKSDLAVGVHTITATAMDGPGQTGSDQITLTVVAPNQPPSVNITAPATGSSFTQGQSITFSGSATDPEEGNVTASLVWTSSLGGPIGNGASFSKSDLAVGVHTITATAMDGPGQTGSAQITLTVVAPNQPPSVNITAPANGSSYTQGQSITFSGSATDLEDGNVTANLVWNSDKDGPIGNGASFSRYDLFNGAHTITASVMDSGGATGVAQINLLITGVNQSPSVNITAPANGSSFTLGQSITFSGSATDPEDGNVTASLVWTSSLGGQIGIGASFSKSDLAVGVHTITATAMDGPGQTGSAQITLTVVAPNQPPSVTITAPATGSSYTQGQSITFSGSATDPEDGNVTASLVWTSSLGGQIGIDASFSKSDLAVGVHTITATAMDGPGQTGSAQITLTVVAPNQPPSVTITAPATGSSYTQGQSITFSGSATDPEDGNVTASLDWNSDKDGAIGNGASFSWSNLSTGAHTITATAMDGPGQTGSAQITLTVVAPNQPPSVTITAPATGSSYTQGQSITFSGSATDPEDGNVTASLDWNSDKDGAIGNGASFSWSNLSTGAHTITATAMDGPGQTGSAQITLTVVAPNQPPSVTITAPATGSSYTQGQSITFSGSATDPEDGNVTASLDWNSDKDGAIGNGASFSWSNLSTGAHTITATAMDGPGQTGSDQITLTVVAPNQPPSVTITAPATGSSYTQGQSITFSGSATDPEDGNVTASLDWNSDKDGAIGNGASFSWSNLSTGAHTITATAMDGPGQTGSAQITLTVVAPNQPPSVTITAPATGSSYTQGQSITFSGSATDPEQGDLSASLTWSSNLSGTIGNGASFSRSDLSIGVHTITASVTDNGGLTRSAQVTLTVVAPNPPPSVSFTAIHDTKTDSKNPTTTNGSATALELRHFSGQTFNTYLKFSVTGLSGPVQSAKVRLYVSKEGKSTDTNSIYLVSNNYLNTSTPWVESGLTWNNAPAIPGSPIATIAAGALGAWIEFDVTAAVQANNVVYSFAVKNGSSTVIRLNSKEATANRPVLVIVTQSGPQAAGSMEELPPGARVYLPNVSALDKRP